MHRVGDPRSLLPSVLALLLATAATSAHAQGIPEPTTSPNVGVGGTDSIIPSIFTHTRPAETVTIKVDSLAEDSRKGIKLVSFNSVPGYDDRPENTSSYTPSCESYWGELYRARIDADSVSTSFEMQGGSYPWVDDAICGVQVYELLPRGGTGDKVFFLFHALSGDEPELDVWNGLDIPGDGRSRTVDVSVGSFGDYHNVGIHEQNFGRVVEIDVAPDAPQACRAIWSRMTIPQFPTRGHADEYDWNITAPRVARGSPPLVCRIRAATHWEGRVVKEAYDTLTFFGASDSRGGCTIEDLGTLSGVTVTREGYWRSACVSPNYTGEYARYYSFDLTQRRYARIDLTSPSVDTRLDLRQGAGTSGRLVDNDGGTGTIDTRLDAGTYTIEATTLRTARSGPFTLTVRTSGDGPDRAALVALYEATNGSGWTNRTNWLSDEPLSEWYGVATDTAGRVTHLRLFSNGLTGQIPTGLTALASLTHLWLNDNDLTGQIPSDLGGLANLGHLSLDANRRLQGPVPLSFANLSSLWTLRLAQTALSGPLPQGLTRLRNLSYLDIRESSLCAPANDAFRTWVQSVSYFFGEFCGGFTDDPIVPGVTPLKALHFTELRMRIDDLRVRHGLGRFRWTDPTLRAGITLVRGVHMSELRSALDQVYDAVGLRGGFSTGAVLAGWEIHTWHINELRRWVEALER